MGLGRLSAMGWLIGCSIVGACTVEEGGAGDDCVRSAECAMGLVCIEGVCSDDLSSIEDPGEVPELMPEDGMGTMMEPNEGEMMMEPDAGEMMMEPDAGQPPPDGG